VPGMLISALEVRTDFPVHVCRVGAYAWIHARDTLSTCFSHYARLSTVILIRPAVLKSSSYSDVSVVNHH
jgi:hypothetical protein